jgi:hypothetical protein
MQANIRPDYHFLIIAPNLGAEWLFDAARTYWNTFQPAVIPDFEFLRLVPAGRTISVTAVVMRDMASVLGVELAQVAPFAYYDAVVYNLFEETRAELNRRAAANEPFGIPLGIGAATTTPSIPTPWLPSQSGFMTATPSPETTDEAETTEAPTAITLMTATPTPPPGTQTPAPIQPTPGPAIGGG